MGIEYALVNDDDQTFIRLGKKLISYTKGCIGFQIHDELISRFLCQADSGIVLRLVSDCSEEYDEIREKYTMVDEWCGVFESKKR